MNISRLSTNKICLITGLLALFIAAVMITALFTATGSTLVIWWGFLFIFLMFLCILSFLALIRQKLIYFSNTLCQTLDEMMSPNPQLPNIQETEDLFDKINYRLQRLYEMLEENHRSTAREKARLQELISDISHQVKTPAANLKMVNSTLLKEPVPDNMRRKFLLAMEEQVNKLEFLMDALIKTSRLEAGIISLDRKKNGVYNTLATALGGILLHAEKKKLNVSVDCPESIKALHDPKWTAEALFNILDNAVKYTRPKGSIDIAVTNWDMYLRIDIKDTGKGIPEKHQAEIFKRFYREEDVGDIEGIGIGLYLSRKIITMQGGYIKVSSQSSKGSVFSVFLPLH